MRIIKDIKNMATILKIFAFCLLLITCSSEKEYNTIISTDKEEMFYNLEIAITPEQQIQGLMNRDKLAPNGGMIFIINPIRKVTMWMKDTKIPLDILFISPEARIIKIVENATPMSEEHLNSDSEVSAVIELIGGSVKKHNIKVGDNIKSTILGNPSVPKKEQ